MSEAVLEALRAENDLLQLAVDNYTHQNGLFLVFLAFFVTIALACILALRQEIFQLWQQHDRGLHHHLGHAVTLLYIAILCDAATVCAAVPCTRASPLVVVVAVV